MSVPLRTKNTRLWWKIHHWAGLKLTIFLSFIFLTGTLAVFGEELDWLMRPAKHVDANTVKGQVNWIAITNATARFNPDVRIESIEAPLYNNFSAQIVVRDKQKKRSFIYAHPTTGQILGTGPWIGIKRALRDIHRKLMLPSEIGIPIVSIMSFLLLISFATAFVVYKKWWKGFLKPIRFGKDSRTAWGDFHRLTGLWSLWFIFVIGLTGLWYFIESLGGGAPEQPFLHTPLYSESPSQTVLDFQASYESAQEAFPDLKIHKILFPKKKHGIFIFHGDYKAILVRPRANNVWVDAKTAEVKLITDARDLGFHHRISEMADFLHFGTIAGIWTKIIWFVFGLFLLSLSLSGMMIYAKRIVKAAQKNKQEKGGGSRVWQGLGYGKWVSLILILLSFFLLGSKIDITLYS